MVLRAYLERGHGTPLSRVSKFDIDFNEVGANNPSQIRKHLETEWRVRHVGTRRFPRYRWRRRTTENIEIQGEMYLDQIEDIEDKLMFSGQPPFGGGIVYTIMNVEDITNITGEAEFFVFDEGLDYITVYGKGRQEDGVFIPWVTYTITGQKIADTTVLEF